MKSKMPIRCSHLLKASFSTATFCCSFLLAMRRLMTVRAELSDWMAASQVARTDRDGEEGGDTIGTTVPGFEGREGPSSC